MPKIEGTMHLMPNPADGNVILILPANTSEGMLTVNDLWGRLLFQQKIPESEGETFILIPSENFSAGIYLIILKENGGKIYTQKLSVNH
jgi:hypothetical protein